MYDELVKRLREFASIPEHCENVESCDGCSKEEICLSFTNKRIIEVATQAADAIEELSKRVPKSGVWREEDGGYDDVFYECSVCGAGVCTVEGDPIDNAWSYCPECGAKMTGIERLPQPPEEEQA